MINFKSKIIEAIKLSSRMHALERYDGKPYHVHVQEVVDVLIEYGETREHLIIGGFLHDLMEASDMSYNDVKKMFGLEVAEIVYLCTDLKGRTRKIRKAPILYLELRENFDAIKVKVADRIANSRKSIETGHEMSNMYKKEYANFKTQLFWSGHIDEMWEELDKLMNFNK